VPPPLATAPVWQRVSPPSWCPNATKLAERLICGNANLASLDLQLSDAFQGARNRLQGYSQQQLIRDQRTWLQQRDSCADDAGCVERAYSARLSQLQGY
jgi:uncharacterized protein